MSGAHNRMHTNRRQAFRILRTLDSLTPPVFGRRSVILVVMSKAPKSVLLASLVAVVVFFGCTRESSVALTKCNQEAKRLYQVEPFKAEHGQWRSDGGQKIWDALTSTGGHDFTARVVFDERGAVVSVDVRMLAHPTSEPATNHNPFPGPDKHEKKLGIPEVMPR